MKRRFIDWAADLLYLVNIANVLLPPPGAVPKVVSLICFIAYAKFLNLRGQQAYYLGKIHQIDELDPDSGIPCPSE